MTDEDNQFTQPEQASDDEDPDGLHLLIRLDLHTPLRLGSLVVLVTRANAVVLGKTVVEILPALDRVTVTKFLPPALIGDAALLGGAIHLFCSFTELVGAIFDS